MDHEQAVSYVCCPDLQHALDPKLFSALGDANRLMLLCRLAASDQALTVNELSSCCGVHLSGVSRHLAQLREAGVIEARKEGRTVYYSLQRQKLALQLRRIADALSASEDNPLTASEGSPPIASEGKNSTVSEAK